MPAEGDAAIDKARKSQDFTNCVIFPTIHNTDYGNPHLERVNFKSIVVGVVLLFGIPVKQAPQPNLPSGLLSVFSANSYQY